MANDLMKLGNKSFLYLVLILIAGFAVRYYNLSDDLTNENQAYNIADIWGYKQAVNKIHLLFQGEKQSYIDHLNSKNPYSDYNIVNTNISRIWRPGYTLSVFVGSIFFEPDGKNTKYFNILTGLLSIIMVFILGRRIYGEKSGLFAALLLTFSLYHVAFSRMINAHFLGSLCILVAVFFHHKSLSNAKRYLYLSGFFVGYSLTCNELPLSLLPIFFLYELFFLLNHNKVSKTISRVAIFSIGMVTLPLVIQAVSVMLCNILGGDLTYFNQFQDVVKLVTVSNPKTNSFSQPLNMIIYFLDSEGIVSLLILMLCFVAVFKNNSVLKHFSNNKITETLAKGTNYYIEIFLTAYMIIWSIAGITNLGHYPPRIYIYALPFIAIFLGNCLNRIEQKYGKTLIFVLILAFVINQGIRSWKIINLKSGYKEAALYLMKHSAGSGVGILSSSPIYKFYYNGINIEKVSSSDELEEQYRSGKIRFFVTDWHYIWCSNFKNSIYLFEKSHMPVKSFSNPPLGYLPYFAYQEPYPSDYLKIPKMPEYIQTIRIYDLNEVFGNSDN